MFTLNSQLHNIEKGFKIVLAKKNSSQETFLMKNVRSFFYKLINKISEIDLTQNTTGAGLFDKDVVNDLKKLEDPYPYFRGLLLELGYKYITINFEDLLNVISLLKTNKNIKLDGKPSLL